MFERFKMLIVVFVSLSSYGCSASKETAWVDEIVAADEFDDLIRPINFLRNEGSTEDISRFAEALLLRINSKKVVLFDPDWNSNSAFTHVSQSKLIDKLQGRMSLREMYSTVQDLSIEGGRCTWALERLLGLYLPPMLRSLDAETRGQFTRETRASVHTQLNQQPNAAIHPQLSTSERLELASKSAQHPWVLAELALDNSPQVRRRVVRQKFCGEPVLRYLKLDENREIRRQAEDRLLRCCHGPPGPKEWVQLLNDYANRYAQEIAKSQSSVGSGSEF